jgi:hypothetical protein
MARHCDDSQFSLILNHLKTKGEINPSMAYEIYGVYRLGAVIFMIRKEGYKVESRIVYFKKPNGRKGRYAAYKLEK